MSLHAFQDVGDALDVAREFLLPLELGRWLKLAVVAFFVGAGVTPPTGGFESSPSTDGGADAGAPFAIPDDVIPLLVALAAVLLILWLVFGIVAAIMEFVLVESLRSGDVSVRTYWSERWRQGLRLFGFRIAIGLPVLALFVGWLALFLLPLFTDWFDPVFSVGAFLLGLPLLFLVGLLYGLVATFTTVFVVPIMVQEDSGVLAAWRHLWTSIRGAWREYLAYAVVGFVLAFATGLLASFVVGIGAVALLVPLAVVGAITYFTVSFSSTLGLVVLGVLVALFVVGIVVLWALVQVPVVTYLRYYALLVLGDVEPAFDLIPDRRAAVRE